MDTINLEILMMCWNGILAFFHNPLLLVNHSEVLQHLYYQMHEVFTDPQNLRR